MLRSAVSPAFRDHPVIGIFFEKCKKICGLCIYFYFCLFDATLAKEFTKRLSARNVYCVKMTGTYCQYEREYCRERTTSHPASSPFAKFGEWPAKGDRAEDFPKTEAWVHRFVSISLGALYTEEDADYIAESVRVVHREIFSNRENI